MRQILVIAVKDLRLITRDWLGVFFILLFPLLMGLFFGFIYGDMSSGSEELEILAVDLDQSEMSGKFLDALRGTGSVDIATRTDPDAALDAVRKGQKAAVVIIPAGYGETAGSFWPNADGEEAPPIQIGADPSRQAETAMLEGLIMQASGELMQERFTDPAAMTDMVDKLDEQIQELANDSDAPIAALRLFLPAMREMAGWIEALPEEDPAAGDGAPDFGLATIEKLDVTRERTPEQQQIAGLRSAWDISFPSAIMWGVLGCVAAFAISIVKEKAAGTFARLQVAPISRAHVLGGKAMACFLCVVGVNAMLIGVGYLMGMRAQSFLLLVLAVLCCGVCFTGIMMLMSVIGKTEEAVGGAGWGINVVMAMFGGGMMPLAFMPGFMKTISHFSPVKWGIYSLEGAIWRGFTFAELLPSLSILVAIGITGMILGSWILKRRQVF